MVSVRARSCEQTNQTLDILQSGERKMMLLLRKSTVIDFLASAFEDDRSHIELLRLEA